VRLMPASLGGRLLLTASLFVLVALLLTGVVMDFALRRFIQGQVDGRLDGQILSVADALRVDPDGAFRLERIVDGPPFERPLSGWYWEVLAPGPVLRSTSLQSQDFALARSVSDVLPKPVTVDGAGPSDEPLRVRVQRMHLGAVSVAIAASAPLHALAGPLHEALTPLAVTLILLAIGLIGGVVLQVRLGLQPLRLLRAELAQVRTGKADRITGAQPSEVRPLVAELNTLLDQNAVNLERARRHVANLAHGLKTPLATLAATLQEPGRDPDSRLGPLITTMDRRIRHHLARARAAALGGGDRARTLLAPKIADHVAAFAKIYADKHLDFTMDVASDVAVACETQDLDEMLGNLIDNACKWARGGIRIASEEGQQKLSIVIDDDGPGLTVDQTIEVMRAGKRVDESAPGYGFGLPITRELAELYGGSLVLTASPLGGLRTILSLPAAIYPTGP
jgi:signal transduction histidine kinase